MNQKNYILVSLLLSIWIFLIDGQAKTNNSHSVNSPETTQQNTKASASDIQEEQITFPKINQILFSGNTVIPTEILTKAIPLKVNDIANEYVIMDSMVKIAQLYKAKNIKVTITPVLEKNSTNSRNIQFDIHEKPNN